MLARGDKHRWAREASLNDPRASPDPLPSGHHASRTPVIRGLESCARISHLSWEGEAIRV